MKSAHLNSASSIVSRWGHHFTAMEPTFGDTDHHLAGLARAGELI